MQLVRGDHQRRRVMAGAILVAGLLTRQPAWSHAPEPGTSYYHQESRGNVVLLADGRGEVVSRLVHAPYGALEPARSVRPAIAQRGWGGHLRDQPAGLVYMGARYYDTLLARFVSVDPARQGTSGYTALAGAPLQHVDPDGRWWRSGFVMSEALRAGFRTGVASIAGAVVGMALPARDGGARGRHVLTGLAAGAAAGAMLSAGHGAARYLSIVRRLTRGKYPIAVLPRGATPRTWFDQGISAYTVLEHFGMSPKVFKEHVTTYERLPTFRPPRTWNGRLVLMGHSDGYVLWVANDTATEAELLDAIYGQANNLDGELALNDHALRNLLAKFSGFREIAHIDLTGCKCGQYLAPALHGRLLRDDNMSISVRGSMNGVYPNGNAGIRTYKSGWGRIASSIRHLADIPVPGTVRLPGNPRTAEAPWQVWP